MSIDQAAMMEAALSQQAVLEAAQKHREEEQAPVVVSYARAMEAVLAPFSEAPSRHPVVEVPPTLRLGKIGERLGFSMTAEFLTSLGFPPAATDKSAKLYRESDFPQICATLVNHIMRVQERIAA